MRRRQPRVERWAGRHSAADGGTVQSVDCFARFAMPQSPPALVPPDTLRWARESMGLTLEEAARKVSVRVQKLECAESGEGYLTLRQAEKAAAAYRRPLAALFVEKPLAEEPPEVQFRQLPGAPSLPWKYEMLTLARLVRERQNAAAELHDLLEEESPWLSLEIGASDHPAELGARARTMLGVELDRQKEWQDPDGYAPLWAWIQAVERLGVLVMQDGSMPLEKMRGFAATHDTVPLIVVNAKDDPRSRAFTVLHELGHLFRARVGLESLSVTEAWLDEFASTVLMPRSSFAADFKYSIDDLLESVDDIALLYGVTPRAAAVRIARLQLATQVAVGEVLEALDERAARASKRSGGGNYYTNIVGNLGAAFIDLVFSALDVQAISSPAASGLLGVKVNNFAKLRERTSQRANA